MLWSNDARRTHNWRPVGPVVGPRNHPPRSANRRSRCTLRGIKRRPSLIRTVRKPPAQAAVPNAHKEWGHAGKPDSCYFNVSFHGLALLCPARGRERNPAIVLNADSGARSKSGQPPIDACLNRGNGREKSFGSEASTPQVQSVFKLWAHDSVVRGVPWPPRPKKHLCRAQLNDGEPRSVQAQESPSTSELK